MQFSPLAIRRHYILGDLNDKCDSINKIPVYLNEVSAEPIGYADESLGRYADAFSFHLPEEICKRLATNGYDLDVDYDVFQHEDANGRSKRVKLNYIILTSRATISSIPRRNSFSKVVARASVSK